MELPIITLPKVELPFDIPVLLHPVVDHFMIALPVVILLLELINLVLKKKAIGGISFFLIFLTIVAAVGAYLTGLADGKEAYSALGEVAKTALSEHKNLGIYLMLGTGVLFLFKFLSSITGNGILRFLYLIVLIVFVAGIFKQGQEGGELVYKYGLNVEQVQTLDDELFDVKEELEEVSSMLKKTNVTPPSAVTKILEVKSPMVVVPAVKVPVAKETPKAPIKAFVPVPKEILAVEEAELKSVPSVPDVAVIPEVKEDTLKASAEAEVKDTEQKGEAVNVIPEVPVVEIAKIPAVPAVIPAVKSAPSVPAVMHAKPALPATPASKAEAVVKPVVETVRTEVKKPVVPAGEQSVKALEVQGMPEEMIQPEIATH